MRLQIDSVYNYNVEIRSKFKNNVLSKNLSSSRKCSWIINPRFKSGSNVDSLIVIARTNVVCLRFRRLMHAIYARFMHTRGKSTIVRRTFVFTAWGIPFTQSRISPRNICVDAAVIGIMHPLPLKIHAFTNISDIQCSSSLVRYSC